MHALVIFKMTNEFEVFIVSIIVGVIAGIIVGMLLGIIVGVIVNVIITTFVNKPCVNVLVVITIDHIIN